MTIVWKPIGKWSLVLKGTCEGCGESVGSISIGSLSLMDKIREEHRAVCRQVNSGEGTP